MLQIFFCTLSVFNVTMFSYETITMVGLPRYKNFDDRFSRFDATLTRNTQTGRHTVLL